MYAFKTDKGIVRNKNEDCVDIFETGNAIFLCVLDGMGGHNKGETASSLALSVMKNKLKSYKKFKNIYHLKRKIVKSIKCANKEVNRLSNELIEYADMGTTLVLCAIFKNKIIICNIGDSRCYVNKGDKFIQLTEDQTYVVFLYKTGKIKYEEIKTHPKRHVLMNALGSYPSISMSIKIYKNEFDKILLCSDGLYNMVDDNIISKVINSNKQLDERIDCLIDLSNQNGGMDNIAIALWEDKI